MKSKQAKKSRKMEYLYSLFVNRHTVKEMRVNSSDEYISNEWRKTRDEVNEELWDFGKKDALSLMICDIIVNGDLILHENGVLKMQFYGAVLSCFQIVC